ncbi:MAG: sporulation protein YabP [Clostridiales bacterium]|nr:sporulation protein YabP [Clostridiales bacterium]
MQYDDRTRNAELPHNVIIEGRSRLSISGVEDVESFDENSVNLYTSKGMLTIRGTGLHMERLSLDTGELGVEGTIDGLQYGGEEAPGGFWSRLFR